MQIIPFVKMHGLGNDFVILCEKDLPKQASVPSLVKKISDRRCGIGCDQLIIYNRVDADTIIMSIYNQDATKASACGNASRCLSRLIFDKYAVKNITLNVGDRKVICQYTDKNDIQVNMGLVSFDKTWMPKSAKLWELAERYLIEPKEMICVDVANPHLVIFSQLSPKDRRVIGQNFQNTDLFPDGINVNFATIEDKKIYLKVWERGAGFTHACGSGAIATFAAANKLGFADDRAEIVFALGSLKMQKIGDDVKMNGSASYAFTGDVICE